MINFLQNYQILARQSNKMGKEETGNEGCSSGKLITELERKTLINRKGLKNIYEIMRKLFETYPPLVRT